MRRELGRRCGSAARKLVGQPRVQLLALAGENRRVDRLRQQRVAEAEGARRRLGHQDAVLHRQAERVAQVVLRKPRCCAEQRISDLTPGGRRQAQQAERRSIEPDHALQEQLAQAGGEAASIGSRQQLLGEEGIPLGPCDDRVHQCGRRWSVGAAREQRRQLVPVERPELEHERGSGATDALGKPAHPIRGGKLVGTVRRQKQKPPLPDVVRQKDDEIERRGVGPVHVLEHEQHGRGSGALGEQRERFLEYPQLRAGRPPIVLPGVSEGTQGLDERLVRQLRTDEIDRAPEQDLEPSGTSACRELGREPGLADARVPCDEDGRTDARLYRVERALELPELPCATDEDVALAGLHLCPVSRSNGPTGTTHAQPGVRR